MSTLVLLITRDRNLTNRLIKSLFDFAGAACLQAQTWLAAGIRFGTMAVNVSAVEFRNDRFLEQVCDILESTGLEPRYLELELTETAVMRNFDECQALILLGKRHQAWQLSSPTLHAIK